MGSRKGILHPREGLAALTLAVRKVRAKRQRKKADLREAAIQQYGVRGGLRVDTDVIEELCGGRANAKAFFPEAIVTTLESGADPDDYEAFAAAFKENIETAETRAIIEGGLPDSGRRGPPVFLSSKAAADELEK